MRNILLVALLFSMNTQAIDLILGGLSHHIGQKRYPDKGRRVKYNSQHRMKGIGFKYGEYYISAINYTNSFYTESTAVSVQYEYKGLYIGGTVANGYDQWNLSNLGKLTAYPSIRYPFKYGSIVMMGAAVAGIISIPIDL